MLIYYIYHIVGIKIGCSVEPEERVRDQGYSEYEILEEHTDIRIASKRERELQREYGYKVDTIPYYQSYERRSAMGKSGGRKAVKSGQYREFCSKGGRKTVESEQFKEYCSKGGKIGGKIAQARMHTCPHCGQVGKGTSMLRWHFDKCKKRPLIS